jgi:hypothetical protein
MSTRTGESVRDRVSGGWEQILRVFGCGDAPWFTKLRQQTGAATIPVRLPRLAVHCYEIDLASR